jgi:hypothetical protein
MSCPGGAYHWAPEIPSDRRLAGAIPSKCELVHNRAHFLQKGRGASVPRSHRLCGPQAGRFNPAGFPIDFGGFRKLLLLRLAWGRSWRSRPTKSRGPPLFEPSLKIPGHNAHNRNSGFAVLPLCEDLNAHRVRKVPRGIGGGCPFAGADRPAPDSPQIPDSPAAFLESCRGHWLRWSALGPCL